MIDLALLALGLVLLVGGGESLVRGASDLARSLGVSAVVIGLTVVAFGTSAPELAVNVSAAWQGRSAISFGNVIGSNLANIGLILGITALVRPLPVGSRLIRRELPLMLLATGVTVLMALDPQLRGEPAVFDRTDGLVLLAFFVVFLYSSTVELFRPGGRDPVLAEAEYEAGQDRPRSRGVCTLLIVAGFAALMAGGRITVDAASSIARDLGLSEAVIGLTVVAVGTSLPELVTSLVAAYRGAADIAMGNVVGSNLFNLLFILGTTATVRPIEVPEDGMPDLLALVCMSLLVLPLAISYQRRVVRGEGALLLGLWVAYTAWRCTAGNAGV